MARAKKKSADELAADATSVFFSGATEPEEQESNEEASEGNTIELTHVEPPKREPVKYVLKHEGEKEEPAEPKKEETVVFGCRLPGDTVARWKAYAAVGGYGNAGKLVDAALQDYMKAHPLKAEQQKAYELAYELNKSKQ